MRILMLSQFYPPYIGGEESVVWNLSTGLAARGHEVAVATLGGEGLPDLAVEQGVRIYRMHSTSERASWLYQAGSRHHAPPVPDPELCLALHRIVQREKPDIVHAHNWLIHSFLPLKARSGAKLALSLHDFSLICATKKLLFNGAPCDGPGLAKCLGCTADHYGSVKGAVTATANWMMGAAERRLVDLFLPVSHATARSNRLDTSGLPYQVIPNFLPAASAAIDSVEPHIAQLPGDGFLLYVGALGAYKGIDVLIEAYAGLEGAPPLVLIGYDTIESPLRTNVFPPGVIVLRNWPHAAVMEAWRRSAIGLAPSLVQETFGMVALEAMAMGRPVIASRIGGLPEVVSDGETGLLVQPGDPVELREAITRLIVNHGERERMGYAAQARATQFTGEAVLPRFEDAYRTMTDVNKLAAS